LSWEGFQLNIQEIERQLSLITDPYNPLIEELKKDKRKGVQKQLIKWEKRLEKERQTREKFQQMMMYEKQLKAEGYQLICGIDEVGRGPLAGPVIAAAVILPDGFYLPGLNDSKQLSEKRREEYFHIIQEEAQHIGIGQIEADEIDRLNIYQATKKAMLDAIQEMKMMPDHLLIDAMKLETPCPQLSLIKGDAKSISIAAASIVAKVTRDHLMQKMAIQYPEYGFDQHMGYGTALHIEALKQYGPCPIHRKTFAPVKDLLEGTI